MRRRDTVLRAATILAGRNIDILAVADTHEQETHTRSSSSGMYLSSDIFGNYTLYNQTSASQDTDSQFARQHRALLR